MALSPLESIEEQAEEVEVQPDPSKTYQLNTNGYTIGGFIEGEDAIRQFVRKAVGTARYRFPIYDGDFGSDMETLIGEDISLELLQAEIPRIVREALIYDDRIEDVTDFEISRDNDKVYVSFNVITVDGTNITEEVEL